MLSNRERQEYVLNLLQSYDDTVFGDWDKYNDMSSDGKLIDRLYRKLPLGAIKPLGWLKQELKLQADGMTGNYYEKFAADINAELYNFFEGFIPLAFLLENEKLIERAKRYVYNELYSQIQNPLEFMSHSGGESAYQSLRALTEYYEITEDEVVFGWITNFFKEISTAAIWHKRSLGNWERWRTGEYMLVGYWLYDHTKDTKILDAIEKNCGWVVENIWSSYWLTGPHWPQNSEQQYFPDMPTTIKQMGDDFWNLHHAVNVAMEIKYPAMYYRMNPRKSFANATFKGLDSLDRTYGLAAGRFTGHEHFEPGPHVGRHPSNGLELCAISELMSSMEKLYEIYGMGRLCDRLELLAYNAYPGQITPDYWCHQYDGESNQVMIKVAKHSHGNDCTSNIYGFVPNFPCCLHNMHAAFPRLTQHMFMGTRDNGLISVVYGPCQVTAEVGSGDKVTITSVTDYPFDGAIKYTISTEKAVNFPLYIRIPGWAKHSTIVCGDAVIKDSITGENVKLQREWKDGDVVDINFEYIPRIERRYNNSASILMGPLYFSLRVGMDHEQLPAWEPNAQKAIDMGYPAVDYEIYPTTSWNYALDPESIKPENIKIVKNTIGKLPFAQKDEPAYIKTEEGKYERILYEQDAPLVLKVKGQLVRDWNLADTKENTADNDYGTVWEPHNLPLKELLEQKLGHEWRNSSADAASQPVSPVEREADEPIVDLEMIPYACARLRVTELPVLDKLNCQKD